MKRHSIEELRSIDLMLKKVKSNDEFSIDVRMQDELVIKSKNNTQLIISSSFPILFLGDLHCVFLTFDDLKSHFEFNKISREKLVLNEISLDFLKSSLNIIFSNFTLILLPQSSGGWQVFEKDVIWIECIEYGGIEVDPFLVQKYNSTQS